MSKKLPQIVLIADPRVANCSVQAADWLERSFGGRTHSADGKMIYIQSRLHEDDELGHVMDDGSCEWPHLVLPP